MRHEPVHAAFFQDIENRVEHQKLNQAELPPGWVFGIPLGYRCLCLPIAECNILTSTRGQLSLVEFLVLNTILHVLKKRGVNRFMPHWFNIEHVYTYIQYTWQKIVPNILMGFQIWCQVGGGGWGTSFSKLPYVSKFSNIWFQISHFFFLFLIEFSHFFENLKNLLWHSKLKKFGS